MLLFAFDLQQVVARVVVLHVYGDHTICQGLPSAEIALKELSSAL